MSWLHPITEAFQAEEKKKNRQAQMKALYQSKKCGRKAVPISIDGEIYESVSVAMKKTGIRPKTIYQWIARGSKRCTYVK